MKDEIKTDTRDMGLRDLAKGYITLFMKAEDTEHNASVHEAFREFCKTETENDYTQGLKRLLEYYQGDYKYEMLYNRLDAQDVVLNDLRESIVNLVEEKEKEPNNGTF